MIPKYIQKKMHSLAKLTKKANELDREINNYFEDRGYDIEKLRCGNGNSLDELNYGNDVTDEFINDIENGMYD